MGINDVYELLDSFARVAGWIVLFGGAIGGLRTLYLWSTHPRIKLSFRRDLTFHRRSLLDRRGEATGGQSIWIHVHASAKARTALRDCRAYLVSVKRKNNEGEWERLPDFNTKLPLPWAHTGGDNRAEVLSGEVAGIDVCFVRVGKPIIFLATTTQGLPTGTAKELVSGEYVLEIKCLASNAKSGSIKLVIEYGKQFAEPKVAEYQEGS